MSDLVIKITLDAEALKSGLNGISARLQKVEGGKLNINESAAESSVKSVTSALEESKGALSSPAAAPATSLPTPPPSSALLTA